jgi:hypothetical protein
MIAEPSQMLVQETVATPLLVVLLLHVPTPLPFVPSP